MDISSISTLLSQAQPQQAEQPQQAQQTQGVSPITDPIEANGEQALTLLESTTERPVDPSNPVGQNIDIYA